ncbi:MAG TPA: ABC transporter ATP-binding protein [Solirubrobacterales bacterium]|nr:ABC transporter ATP-binding protein [Solirubrobacterales bacterium]
MPRLMPQGTPIEVRGLVKRYGSLVAVDDVDLTVERGDVFGYLGPNGAGKTTSLRMMLGLIRPTAGSVRLFGRDPQLSVAALEGVAGFVEAPSFYPYLNGRENLRLFAALDGGEAATRIEESLAIVGLSERAKDRVGGYSHGMRQRLGIAAALLRAPRLLLLDEPATGLDPGGMRDMRDLIRELSGRGMTVLLSSHLLAEVEELCNRVAIVRSGRVAYQGSLADLRQQAGEGYLLRTTDDDRALRVAAAQPGITDALAAEAGIRFSARDEEAVSALSLALAEAGALTLELSPRHATLEDLFFRLTEGEPAAAVAASPGPGDNVVPLAGKERAA